MTASHYILYWLRECGIVSESNIFDYNDKSFHIMCVAACVSVFLLYYIHVIYTKSSFKWYLTMYERDHWMEMHSHSLSNSPCSSITLDHTLLWKFLQKPINPNTCVIICTVPQGVDAILYRFSGSVSACRFL